MSITTNIVIRNLSPEEKGVLYVRLNLTMQLTVDLRLA
jgi:hypothetical protein